MKPWNHAKNSAKKYGGEPEEYMEIHNFMDSSKSAIPDMRHRAMFHNAFGIFVCEKVFGNTLTLSTGKVVSVRDIAEDHVLEDLGMIPTLEQWFKNMKMQDWMFGSERGKKDSNKFIPMDDEADKPKSVLTPELAKELLEEGRRTTKQFPKLTPDPWDPMKTIITD